MSELFSYVRNIMTNGVYDDELPDYNPFVINIALSMHLDLVLYANEANLNAGISERMHYDFLFHAIQKRKRYAKWQKGEKASTEDVGAIMEYFKYSHKKAKEVAGILTQEKIAEIKAKITKE